MAKVKIGEVWDRTTEFVGDSLPLLLPIALVSLLIPTSLMGSLADLQVSGSALVRAALGLLQIAFALLSLWGQLAIAALAIDPPLGSRVRSVALARLPAAIGVYLIPFILVALIFGVQWVTLMIYGGFDVAQISAGEMDVRQINLPPGVGQTVAVLFLVELAVVLFVLARLLPLTGVIVAERRGLGAYARAFRLTRGMTWKLLGVILLYAVVAWVSSLAATTVFGSILRLVAPGEGSVTVAGVLTAIAAAAVQAVFTVLAAAFCAKLYVALVRATEPNPTRDIV